MTIVPFNKLIMFLLTFSLLTIPLAAEAKKKKNIFNKIGSAVKNTANAVGKGVKNTANAVGGGIKQGAGFVGGGIKKGIGGIKNKLGGGASNATQEEFYEEEPMMEEELAYEEDPGMEDEVAYEVEPAYTPLPRKKFGGIFGQAKAAMERAKAQAAAAEQRERERVKMQNATISNIGAVNNIHGAMARANQARMLKSAMEVPSTSMRAENRVVSRGGMFGRNVRNVSMYQAPSQSQVRTGRVSISGANFMQRGSRSVQRAKAAAPTQARSINHSLLNQMNGRAAVADATDHPKPVLKPMPIVQTRPLLKPALRPGSMLASKYKLSEIRMNDQVRLNDNFSQISTKLSDLKASAVVRSPASAVKYAQPNQQIRFASPVLEAAPVRSFARPNNMIMQKSVNNFSN